MSNEFIARKGFISLGGVKLPFIDVNTTYNISLDDYRINCTSGSFNITLPDSTNNKGKTFEIKNSGVGTITVLTTNNQTIDDLTGYTINQYASVTIISDDTNWIVGGINVVSEEVETLQTNVADVKETNVAETLLLSLRTTIREDGVADDDSLVTEKSVRNELETLLSLIYAAL